MRPQLREHVWFVKVPDGVHVHGSGGAATLRGGQTYEWLARLAPHLTGAQTLDELVAPLSDAQQKMVRDVVDALVEQQFVVDAGTVDRPHSLDDDEQRIYAPELAFVGFGLDSPGWRFQRFREARIGVVGSGPVLAELVAAGVWSGWRRTRVAAPAGELDAIHNLVTLRDDRQELLVEPSRPLLDGWLPAFLAEVDVVLHVGSTTGRTDAITVARACERAGLPLGQVLVDGTQAWSTRVGPPADTRAESCWRRLAERQNPSEDWLIGPVPGLVATQLALSCFTHLTGLDALPGAPAHLSRLDLRTLVTTTHRVPIHPRAERVADPTVEELIGRAPVTAADLLDRATGVVDEHTGLVRLLAEEELGQVPIAVCRATVADPDGVLPAGSPPPTVHGWGIDRATARLHTVLAALATYGTLTIPHRPDDVWGIDPLTDTPVRVPVALAYSPRPRETAPYRVPVGAAAALTWDGAVAGGLRAHCTAILRRDGRPGAPVADLAGLVADTADPDLAQLHELLRVTGTAVEVEDLGDRLKLPAFTFRVGAAAPITTCATSVADALRDGLEQVLLRWQTGLRPLGPLAPARAGSTELVEALQRHGHRPVAVPIARDAAARDLLPHVVQVVLLGD
jgi:hypothetical protein